VHFKPRALGTMAINDWKTLTWAILSIGECSTVLEIDLLMKRVHGFKIIKRLGRWAE